MSLTFLKFVRADFEHCGNIRQKNYFFTENNRVYRAELVCDRELTQSPDIFFGKGLKFLTSINLNWIGVHIIKADHCLNHDLLDFWDYCDFTLYPFLDEWHYQPEYFQMNCTPIIKK